MIYTIRECLESDAVSIWMLNCEEMGYTYPLEETEKSLLKLMKSGSDKIFVALIDDAVVGYVHACDYDLIYAPHMKNIMGIAVTKSYKHQGIGRALLEQVEAWALRTGAAGVRLTSGKSRTEAHTFYHRCGYEGDKEQLNLSKIF